MKIKLTLYSLITWILSTGALWAQRPDSLGNVNFNALNHVLQERYAPARKPFDRRDKKAHTSLQLFAGGSNMILGSTISPRSTDFGLSFVRDWSSLHTFRFSTLYSHANKGYDGGLGIQHRYGVEFDDLFHLLDFLGGYHGERHFDIQTVAGFGLYYTDPQFRSSSFSFGGHIGLHLSRVIYKHLGLFVEPRVNLFTDGYDAVTGVQNFRQYHTGAQLLLGSTYYFKPFSMPKHATDDMYIEYYAGLTGDYSQRMNDHFDGLLNRVGPTLGMGIGKWYLPLGYRFTLFTGMQQSPMERKEENNTNFLGGLRLEAMLNLNNFFNHDIVDPRWEVNAGLGYEASFLVRDWERIFEKDVALTHGLTASAQLLYRLTPRYGLFVQGRYSDLSYDEDFRDGRTESRYKHNIALEFGLRCRHNRHQAASYNRSFKPYTYLTMSGGANVTVEAGNCSSLGDLFDTDLKGSQFKLGIARRFSPYSTVRGRIETGTFGIGDGEKSHPFTLSAAYMLDLTTLLTRYRADRVFTLSPFAGILYTHHERGTNGKDTRKKYNDGHYIGVELGVNEHFRLTDKWGLFLEENFHIYHDKINPSAPTYTDLKLSTLLELNMGISYKL